MSGGGGQCSAEKTGRARCSSQAGEEPLQGPVRTESARARTQGRGNSAQRLGVK